MFLEGCDDLCQTRGQNIEWGSVAKTVKQQWDGMTQVCRKLQRGGRTGDKVWESISNFQRSCSVGERGRQYSGSRHKQQGKPLPTPYPAFTSSSLPSLQTEPHHNLLIHLLSILQIPLQRIPAETKKVPKPSQGPSRNWSSLEML